MWGLTQVSSLGGSHYYVIFIDESTQKMWVYFLKKKNDVFENFKKWKALVENEIRKKLKCLRLDNGGEYCSKSLKDYCSINRMRRKKTILRTPQGNGLYERMNRIIMESARSMRFHTGLPLHFWVDVVNIFVYLINIGPSTPLDGGIPEETWTGKRFERMNRTIIKHARSMRLHVGLPLHFLTDIVNTIVYLIKRGPSTPLDGGILEEI